jgi:arylsulfatase A-like enzyme
MRPLFLLLPLGLSACACGSMGETPPHVLILCLDTLRADRLGCYGGTGNLTPNLDALAAQATRWERCSASSPWTVPSHASMFTGKHPSSHGAYSFEVEDMSVDNCFVLEEEQWTLAEALRGKGYATAGIVANAVYLKGEFGLSQGFDHWSISRERAPRLCSNVLGWIDDRAQQRDSDRPWTMFVNFMDTHRPYNVEPLPGEREYDQATEYSSDLLNRLYQQVIVRGEEAGDLGLTLQDQYNRAVRNLDLALGEFFEELKQRGLWDDLLLVVVSDHGEYFGEHGLVEHSKDVYEPALSVPLLIKYPGQTVGEVRSERAGSAHLPALILDGLTSEVSDQLGPDFPQRPGGGFVVSENHYSRLPDILHPTVGERFRRVRTVVYDGPFKLIQSSDGNHELYNLGEDPGEMVLRNDLDFFQMHSMLDALSEELKGTESARERETVSVDGERLNDLRAMGYAGGPEGD